MKKGDNVIKYFDFEKPLDVFEALWRLSFLLLKDSGDRGMFREGFDLLAKQAGKEAQNALKAAFKSGLFRRQRCTNSKIKRGAHCIIHGNRNLICWYLTTYSVWKKIIWCEQLPGLFAARFLEKK